MYEFWLCKIWILIIWLCKTKISANAELCYLDTDSFNVYVKTKDIFKDIPENLGKLLKKQHDWDKKAKGTKRCAKKTPLDWTL